MHQTFLTPKLKGAAWNSESLFFLSDSSVWRTNKNLHLE